MHGRRRRGARNEADRLRDREARLHRERMHAMGVVASGLAHDLNHSLNVIALRIATMRADRRFGPARRSLDVLSRVVEQAAATVARLQAANRPGGGSTYTLTFPLASPRQPQKERQGRSPRKARVLLVDDEIDNLEVLEELLELEGHRVETAASGKEAVHRFERGERYDLVLCDVGMPQMSGWQVVREIRRIAPGTRIWLLTGWANEISEQDPRLAGVQGVLGKPLDLDQLRWLLGDPQGPTPDRHHATA